jgi:hypothetical protein
MLVMVVMLVVVVVVVGVRLTNVSDPKMHHTLKSTTLPRKLLES